MLPELFYFLKGYVIIKIEGSFPEKFINMSLCKNVYIWDIKKVNKNTVIMKMSAGGFRQVRELAERTGCTAYIIDRKGLPYIIKRYKKRTAMLIGICLFSASIAVMSAFLWDIEVKGNERVPTSVILKQLEAAGLKNGVYLKNVDVDMITLKVMSQNADISWMGINIKGTKATVEIAEGAPKPALVDKDTVCSIVSEKDGVIEEIITRNGFPVVKKGDTVHEGQLLVSGVTDSPAVLVRGVHADADITLRCWYDKTASVALNQTVRKPLDEVKNRYRIIAGGRAVNLYFGGEPFEVYDLEVKDRYFFGKINFQKNIYTKVKEESLTLTEKEAILRAQKQIEEEMTKMLADSGKIVSTDYVYDIKNGVVSMNARIETIESAGEKIVINQ